jgi:dolichol-phosphate mannosyltransferase
MMSTSEPGRHVVVVMPAYNEAECITGFLVDLHHSLRDWSPSFVVVDDASSDGTADVIRRLEAPNVRVTVVQNAENVGHGASTLRALQQGLGLGAELVLAVDGDGHFLADDLACVVATAFLGGHDVVEGTRKVRTTPLYRRSVSTATRFLVWITCAQWPADANTPVRAYRPAALAQLLDTVPPDTSIPNLFVSSLSRRLGLRVIEVPVRTTDRKGADPVGTTWKARWAGIPSRRFLAFCWKAAKEWGVFVRSTVRTRRGV